MGRIESRQGDRNSTGRPTELPNLDPWGLSETEPTTKEHICAKDPSTYIADVQFSLHVDLSMSLKLLSFCGIHFSTGLPYLASMGEDVLNPEET